MKRFKPKDLREEVAMMIANDQGFHSAAMIRKHLALAEQIIALIEKAKP